MDSIPEIYGEVLTNEVESSNSWNERLKPGSPSRPSQILQIAEHIAMPQ